MNHIKTPVWCYFRKEKKAYEYKHALGNEYKDNYANFPSVYNKSF